MSRLIITKFCSGCLSVKSSDHKSITCTLPDNQFIAHYPIACQLIAHHGSIDFTSFNSVSMKCSSRNCISTDCSWSDCMDWVLFNCSWSNQQLCVIWSWITQLRYTPFTPFSLIQWDHHPRRNWYRNQSWPTKESQTNETWRMHSIEYRTCDSLNTLRFNFTFDASWSGSGQLRKFFTIIRTGVSNFILGHCQSMSWWQVQKWHQTIRTEFWDSFTDHLHRWRFQKCPAQPSQSQWKSDSNHQLQEWQSLFWPSDQAIGIDCNSSSQ